MYIMDKFYYFKMNEFFFFNNFLFVLNRNIILFMNLWKYLLSCLCGVDVCFDEVGEFDFDIFCEGLFFGGLVGEVEIFVSVLRIRRIICKIKIYYIKNVDKLNFDM